MVYALAPFASVGLDDSLLELLLQEHERHALPRLSRLWSYYRNALAEPTEEGGSSGPPAQRVGLPSRLLGAKRTWADDRIRREVVVENDIAWRIHTLVDFMFPDSPRIVSEAADPQRRRQIESLLAHIIESNGGTGLWQNAALLGSVYGHIDFIVTCNPAVSPADDAGADDRAAAAGRSVAIDIVEPTRAAPLLSRHDYRRLDAYIVHFRQPGNTIEREGMLARLKSALKLSMPRFTRIADTARRSSHEITEIHSATHSQRYEDGTLVHESANLLGRLPVVHVQNLGLPLFYEGLSDVEPLIPLQDELNTRLSDRANRVTMQSFRMWLAKGLEGFGERPIGPGQMWSTENTNASIEAFGGDADSPSERQHLEDLREALDKASGVTPAAAGHIKARVGNLTSENALRISLMGTIAKIKRKRITYGQGIRELCDLVLHTLDAHGVFRTEPQERRTSLVWTDPIPSDESRRISDALAKARLGVPAEVLRAELGYENATAAG